LRRCIGGGLIIAMMCDLLVAAESVRAFKERRRPQYKGR